MTRSKTITSFWVARYAINEFKRVELKNPQIGSNYEITRDKVDRLLSAKDIVRVKVWNKEMVVVWSDNQRLIGQKFPNNNQLKEAFDGKTISELVMTNKPEQKYEQSYKRLLELYIPIRFEPDGEIESVFEIYQNLDILHNEITYHKLIVWISTISGFAILYFVLFAIMWRTSNRIETQEVRRLESEERFRTVIEQAGDAMFLIDPSTGNFLEANQRACTVLGYTRDELLTLSVPDIDPVYSKENFGSFIENFTPNNPVTIEAVHQRKDGATFPVEIRTGLIEIAGNSMLLSFARDITERKAAEDELRNNQRLLQTVFNTVPNWLFVKDRASRYQIVNRSMADFFKLRPEDFVNKTYKEIGIDIDDTTSGEESDRTVLETKNSVTVPEMRAVAPDGSYRYRHVIKLPLMDDDGNMTGIVGASEDITERKQAEEQLRDSQHLLQTVFNTIPVGISVKDLEGRYLMVNPVLADFFELTRQEMIGRTSVQLGLSTKTAVQKISDADHIVLETGKRVEIADHHFIFANGNERWRQTVKAPLFDGSGRITGVVG